MKKILIAVACPIILLGCNSGGSSTTPFTPLPAGSYTLTYLNVTPQNDICTQAITTNTPYTVVINSSGSIINGSTTSPPINIAVSNCLDWSYSAQNADVNLVYNSCNYNTATGILNTNYVYALSAKGASVGSCSGAATLVKSK